MLPPLRAKSTRDRRYGERMKKSLRRWSDQWGRTWYGVWDKESGHPVGFLNLAAEFRVPSATLIPDQKYFTFADPETGSLSFTVEVERWQSDLANGWNTWRERLSGLAAEKGQINVTRLEDLPIIVKQIIGASPMHEKFLAAVALGNAWTLGKKNPATGDYYPTPAWAVPILHTLDRRESLDGGGVITQFDADELADEDHGYAPVVHAPITDSELDPSSENPEIVERLAAELAYEGLNETNPPQKTTPVKKTGPFQNPKKPS